MFEKWQLVVYYSLCNITSITTLRCSSYSSTNSQHSSNNRSFFPKNSAKIF